MKHMDEPSPQLTAIADALRGSTSPCMTVDPDVWFDQPDLAVRLCTDCKAQTACLEYAAAIRATAGVWGGHDFDTDRRRRLAADRRRRRAA